MEPTAAVIEVWNAFARTQPKVPAHYDVWFFGDSAALAAELLALVVAGKKTASCGLQWEAGTDASPTPVEGGYSVVTDFDGVPGAILLTTEVRLIAFGEIDEAFALEEGEGSFEEWRAGHWDFFSRRCALLGRTPALSMPVLCERFEVVHLP